MRCALYVRCFYESFYLDWFIEYYLNLDFDYIVILKADNIKYIVPEKLKKKVYIRNVENVGNALYQKYLNIIKIINPDWVFMIDIDEILILENNNIKKFIKNKLKIDSNINCFYFQWLMMERYDNQNLNLKDSYDKYKLFNNCNYKSLALLKNINGIKNPHSFKLNNYKIEKDNIIYNYNIDHTNNNSENESYKNYLLHIHTRSLNNLVLKSLITILNNKHIKDKNSFKEFVNKFCCNNNNILENFKNSIGKKATLPYSHSNGKIININKNHPLFNKKIVNYDDEKKVLHKLLKKNNINIEKYELMIQKLEKEISNHFIN